MKTALNKGHENVRLADLIVQFKKVGRFWSARITDDYRAVGVKDQDTIVWFWIGIHAEYDKLLKRR